MTAGHECATGTIVISAPRSGTTVLRRMLDAHPEISCPPDINVTTHCARMLREERVNGGLAMGMVSGPWFAGFDAPTVVGRVRDLAIGLNNEIRTSKGKQQWVEKSYFHGFLIDEIEQLYSTDCRYLCLVRHGLDVVYSMHEHCIKIGTYPGELHEYVRRYNRPLEAFAHVWADTVARMRRLLQEQPGSALKVRYEDLVTCPEQELERILEFLGVEDKSDPGTLVSDGLGTLGDVGLGDWKTYQKPTLVSDSVGRWKSEDRETLRPLAAIVNPELVAWGYEPVTIPRPLTDEQARRRLKMGLEISWIQAGAGGQQ